MMFLLLIGNAHARAGRPDSETDATPFSLLAGEPRNLDWGRHRAENHGAAMRVRARPILFSSLESASKWFQEKKGIIVYGSGRSELEAIAEHFHLPLTFLHVAKYFP